jgi:hypothetical protein
VAHVFAHNGRPRTHLRGDHFHFSQQIFILFEGGARPAGHIAAGVAYFDTPHFDISAHFDSSRFAVNLEYYRHGAGTKEAFELRKLIRRLGSQ